MQYHGHTCFDTHPAERPVWWTSRSLLFQENRRGLWWQAGPSHTWRWASWNRLTARSPASQLIIKYLLIVSVYKAQAWILWTGNQRSSEWWVSQLSVDYKPLSYAFIPLLIFWVLFFKFMHEDANNKGNGTPLQYSCLENPMDGGAW